MRREGEEEILRKVNGSVDEATEEKFLLLGGPMGASAIGRLPCFPEAFKSYAVQRI